MQGLAALRGLHAAWLLLACASATVLKAKVGEISKAAVRREQAFRTPLPKPVAVPLKRTHDFQHTYYYGEMTVGGYPQVVMLDSGSWQLVLPATCEGQSPDAAGTSCCPSDKCPKATYRLKSNRSVERSELEEISYLGGSVVVLNGHDTVTLPGLPGWPFENIPVSVVVDHEVPILKTASAQAIFGISPGDAWGNDNEVLTTMGVDRIPVCLEQSGEGGVALFNDSPKGQGDAGSWRWVASSMKKYWGSWSNDWKLSTGTGEAETLGCVEDDCALILDTGTPLMNLPGAMYDKMEQHIRDRGIEDCSDLSRFPTLNFTIGGLDLSLSPEAYIADGGEAPAGANLRMAGLQFPVMPMTSQDRILLQSGKAFRQCVLLFEHYGEDATIRGYGPLITLGLLSFRDYEVQFDLAERIIRFGEARADCSANVSKKSRLPRPSAGARKLLEVVPHKLAPSLLAKHGAAAMHHAQ